MSGVKDSLIDLERHRQKLEESANQLRKALQHWQTWDAEYEALKEEIDAVADTTPDDLERIRNDFEGELVSEKDIDEIFGKGQSRSKDDIISLLDKRIDYVTESIQSLKRQLEVVENKHAVASVVSQPDAVNEDGQPITDIIEELDEEDNVVSYSLNQPGTSLPHIREALSKAGVKNISDLEKDLGQNAPDAAGLDKTSSAVNQKLRPTQPTPKAANTPPPTSPAPEPVLKSTKTSTSTSAQPQAKKIADKTKKKGVSFSDDTKPAEESTEIATAKTSARARRVENIIGNAKDQERTSREQEPVIPDDEDPEDAALRREMLNYSMGEMGAVVAELELEEYQSGDDDIDVDYSDSDLDEDEDEDKYGRTTTRMVSDQYRERMLELEKKLGIQSRFTQATSNPAQVPGEEGDSDSDDEGIGRIVINRNPAASTANASSAKEPEKKGVRFAESLDIARSDESAAAQSAQVAPTIEPVSDIVERSSKNTNKTAKPARTTSRFKQARGEDSRDDGVPKGPLDAPSRFLEQDTREFPTGPEGMTIANDLVERDAPSRPAATNDDFIDDGELASEHSRLRTKFIQREGGFLKENEAPVQLLDEAGEGREKMSRFKAARLSKQ